LPKQRSAPVSGAAGPTHQSRHQIYIVQDPVRDYVRVVTKYLTAREQKVLLVVLALLVLGLTVKMWRAHSTPPARTLAQP
jgi:hypothetical protein